VRGGPEEGGRASSSVSWRSTIWRIAALSSSASTVSPALRASRRPASIPGATGPRASPFRLTAHPSGNNSRADRKCKQWTMY
jgi:hypothetical protein